MLRSAGVFRHPIHNVRFVCSARILHARIRAMLRSQRMQQVLLFRRNRRRCRRICFRLPLVGRLFGAVPLHLVLVFSDGHGEGDRQKDDRAETVRHASRPAGEILALLGCRDTVVPAGRECNAVAPSLSDACQFASHSAMRAPSGVSRAKPPPETAPTHARVVQSGWGGRHFVGERPGPKARRQPCSPRRSIRVGPQSFKNNSCVGAKWA